MATFPLTARQREIWLDQLLSPETPVYNIGAGTMIDGPVDPATVAAACAHVIDTNDALRLQITDVAGEPRLRLSACETPLAFVDLSNEVDPDAAAHAWLDADFGRMFVLYDAPLFRFALLKLSDDRYCWYQKYHHAIIDGWSGGLITERVAAAYVGLRRGEALPPTYPSFLELVGEVKAPDRHREYWVKKLTPLPEALFLQRPDAPLESGKHSILLDRAFYEQLQTRARATGASEFQWLLAALCVYLRRVYRRRDVVVGLPVLSRPNDRARNTVGLMVNLNPFRIDIAGHERFDHLVTRVKRALAQDFRHQRLSIGEINRAVGLHESGRRQVFDVTLSFERQNFSPSWDGAPSETRGLSANREQAPLLISVREFGHDARVWIDFEFNQAYLDASEAEGFTRHFDTLLHDVVAHPDRLVSEVRLLADAEQRPQVADVPRAPAVVDLFEQWATAEPDRLAVKDSEDWTTYGELNEEAARIARRLRSAHGVERGDLVAVRMRRSTRMVATLFGILKAGAAYLPIDPATPGARVATILKDARCAAVVDDDWFTGPDAPSLEDARRSLTPHDLAYVIYTSGSTGAPKGCSITHGNLANYVAWACERYLPENGTPGRFPLFTSLAFDFTVTSIFCPLTSGGSVVVFADDVPADVVLRETFDARSGINVVKLTPAHTALLDDLAVGTSVVATAIVGGEALTHAHVTCLRRLGPMRIVNEYGPSETTVGCVAADVEAGMPITVGQPIANTRAHVLDEFLNVQPVGASGEIFIGGACVGAGYYRNPRLTAQAYVPDPFGQGERMYRTGDLGRWDVDGELRFEGRVDDQVKIRGHRVECGEIAARLVEADRVRAAVVVPRPHATRGTDLVAYVAADTLDVDRLRAHLSQTLPDYMLPARFVRLDRLPLTINGKVDRRALPDVQDPAAPSVAVTARTDKEALLARLWAEHLGHPVGIHDNLFSAGADSIAALRVMSKLRAHGFVASIQDVFRFPDVARLARVLSPLRTPSPTADSTHDRRVPLTPIQSWFFEHADHARDRYSHTVTLNVTGRLDVVAIRRALETITRRHDALRTSYVEGAGRFTAHVRDDAPVHLEFVPASTDLESPAFDLANGPLMKATLIRGRARDQLVIAIHHLAVDGVSWRVLLEDLEAVYRAESPEEPTDTFQRWTRFLREYARRPECQSQLDYWRRVVATPVTPLPATEPARDTQLELTPDETDTLLTSANLVYGTRADELLLTALIRAQRASTGSEQSLIAYESHGRHAEASGLDVSRTVGWFTSVFPVAFDVSGASVVGDEIRAVADTLRRVPDHGLAYGVLAQSPDLATRLEIPRQAIRFNYLGRFDDVGGGTWSLSELPLTANGPVVALDGDATCTALVQNRRLTIAATNQTLANLWKRELQVVIEHCRSAHERVLDETGVAASAVEEVCPLTTLQEGLLFEHVSERRQGAYIQQVTCRVRGRIDVERFRSAWDRLAERHTALRTAFVYRSLDRPRRVVLRQRPVPFAHEDLMPFDAVRQGALIEAHALAERERPFDPARDPLMRVAVLQTRSCEQVLVWTYHHVILDGWSMALLFDEVWRLYHGETLAAPPRAVIDEAESMPRPSVMTGRADDVAVLPRVPVATRPEGPRRLRRVARTMDRESSDRLRTMAARNAVTVGAVIQAAWGALLARYNRLETVTFGTTVSGRTADVHGADAMVGLFIDTVPVEVRAQRTDAFRDVVRRVHDASVETEPRHAATPAAFDHLLILDNYPIGSSLLNDRACEVGGGIRISEFDVREETHYDFTMSVITGDRLELRLAYASEVYDDVLAERVGAHFLRVLDTVSRDESAAIGQLPLLANGEEKRVLEWNGTGVAYPKNVTLVSAFELQVERTPHAVALVAGDRRLSFDEVNRQANTIASELRDRFAVTTGDLVVLMLQRSEWMLPSILGILKAGAAYVPVDPGDPPERTRYVLADCGARVLVTSASFAADARRDGAACEVLEVDHIAPRVAANPPLRAGADDLAYVLYTSGSTGRPKGVMVEHRPVVNQLAWLTRRYATAADVVLQKTPFTFDISVLELFSWACCGSTLVMLGPGEEKDPAALVSAIERDGVTIVHFVPSLLHMLVEHLEAEPDAVHRLSTLRRVFACGEPLGLDLARRFDMLCRKNGTTLHNLYGPTEATCDVSYFDCGDPADLRLMPIGRPIPNTQLYVVDPDLGTLMPPGCAGEICIGGIALARGYLNRPELTAASFVDNPFAPGTRMYRTGDLGTWLPDGNLAFLGRIDGQVKVAGHRIECGEVEHALLRHPDISEAVVVARTIAASRELVAYVVAARPLDVTELRAHLSAILPQAMIPSRFVALPALPLTSNGKVDRRALPEPVDQLGTGSTFVPPQDDIEHHVASIWQRILRLEHVSAADDFFALGGDSLKLFRVSNQLNDRYPGVFRISDLFNRRTVREIASVIREQHAPRLAASAMDDVIY